MSGAKLPDDVPLPDDLLHIVADLAKITRTDGLVAGSGALRIETSPLQMAALASVLPSRAIIALGLALHHGILRTDPIRVEVRGWGRDWLIAKGMVPNQARFAAKDLYDSGIVVTLYGEDGASSERLGVIGADRCGWEVPDLKVLPGAAGRRPTDPHETHLAENPPGATAPGREPAKPQVTTLGGKSTKGVQPVDNPLVDFSPRGPGLTVVSGVESGTKQQVSTLGGNAARGETDRGTTSSSVSDQIVLSARGVLASRSLTLADVHTLVSSPALHEAAVTAGDGLLVHLTDLLSRADRDRVAAVVEFHGYAPGGSPHMVIAALLAQIVQTDPDDRDDIVNDLFDRCRAGKANLPRPPAEEFLAGWVLTMTGAMVSDVSVWGGWVSSGIRRPSWTVSPVMLDVLACFAHLAEAGALTGAPAPVTGRDPNSAGVGGEVTSDEPVVRRDPVTGEWPAEVMEELHAAVAGTAYADELTLQTVLGNAAWVNRTLTRWRKRTSTEVSDPATDEPVAMEESPTTDANAPEGASMGTSEGEDLEGGMTDEERLIAHADMLAVAVAGTKWAEEEEWERLLANPTLQSRLLHRHKVNQILIAQGGNALSLDSIT